MHKKMPCGSPRKYTTNNTQFVTFSTLTNYPEHWCYSNNDNEKFGKMALRTKKWYVDKTGHMTENRLKTDKKFKWKLFRYLLCV